MTGPGPVLRNSGWMIAEQVLRQGLSLAVTVWVARQYGPESFGALSYSLTLFGLFSIIATLGLNRILVRELAETNTREQASDLLSTVLALRLSASVLVLAASIATCLVLGGENLALVAILSLGFFCSAFDVIDLHFQSRLRSADVAKARLPAFLVSCAVKMAAIIGNADLRWLAFTYLLEWIFAAVALRLAIGRTGMTLGLRANPALSKRLLGESWPEIIAGFSGLAFMKIDQLMLQAMRGPAEVATMAVSSRITEAWYFLPAALVSSSYPVLVGLLAVDPQAAAKRLQTLLRHLLWLSVVVAVTISLVSHSLIDALYGAAYLGAAPVLAIQSWCGVFMCLGIASGAWLMANKLGHLNLRRNLFGAAVNVTLNLVLIPRYGALGAAWATLAAFACAYLIYDLLDPGLRPMAAAKLRSLTGRS